MCPRRQILILRKDFVSQNKRAFAKNRSPPKKSMAENIKSLFVKELFQQVDFIYLITKGINRLFIVLRVDSYKRFLLYVIRKKLLAHFYSFLWIPGKGRDLFLLLMHLLISETKG